MLKRFSIPIILALCTLLQAGNIRKHPGYVDLSRIKVPEDAFERTDIFIDSGLIEMIFPDFEGDAAVTVKGFDLADYDEDKIKEEIQRIEKQLNKGDWESLVRVKSNNEVVNISTKIDTKTGKKQGFMLVAYEPGCEVTFLNIAGKIPFEDWDGLHINLDDETIDELKRVLGGSVIINGDDD